MTLQGPIDGITSNQTEPPARGGMSYPVRAIRGSNIAIIKAGPPVHSLAGGQFVLTAFHLQCQLRRAPQHDHPSRHSGRPQ